MRAKLCLSLVAFVHLCAVSMAQEKPAAVTSPIGATYITHVTVIDTEGGKRIEGEERALSPAVSDDCRNIHRHEA